MSELGFSTQHRTRHRRGRGRGLLAVVLALVIVLGGGTAAVALGGDALSSLTHSMSRKDYKGSGHGTVTVSIKQGATLSSMGAELQKAGVVASVDAFVRAARSNPDALRIQPGTYRVKHQMSGKLALLALLDPTNRVVNKLTVPEGMRAEDIYAALSRKTGIPVTKFVAAAKHPHKLGLPAYAKGVEGYLYPATYEIPAHPTAAGLLGQMVQRYLDEAKQLQLTSAATRHHLTTAQLVTVASLVQAEARRPADFGKVARVIYNRLRVRMPLKLDSTSKYADGYDGKVLLTKKQLNLKSPYNTYKHAGLPPTPIGSPGRMALKAAMSPTPGRWMYFVTTNPVTGYTVFTVNDKQFVRARHTLLRWCHDHRGKC